MNGYNFEAISVGKPTNRRRSEKKGSPSDHPASFESNEITMSSPSELMRVAIICASLRDSSFAFHLLHPLRDQLVARGL